MTFTHIVTFNQTPIPIVTNAVGRPYFQLAACGKAIGVSLHSSGNDFQDQRKVGKYVYIGAEDLIDRLKRVVKLESQEPALALLEVIGEIATPTDNTPPRLEPVQPEPCGQGATLEDSVWISWEEAVVKSREEETSTHTESDGSTAEYYELPEGAKELQDIIAYKDMNGQISEIFRACMRYGQVLHSPKLRDAKKIRYYINAEIERLEKYENASA